MSGRGGGGGGEADAFGSWREGIELKDPAPQPPSARSGAPRASPRSGVGGKGSARGQKGDPARASGSKKREPASEWEKQKLLTLMSENYNF
jgi:hypothetical protein